MARQNLEKVIKRGDNLDDLRERAGTQDSSAQFNIKQYYITNNKHTIILYMCNLPKLMVLIITNTFSHKFAIFIAH